MSNYTYLVLYVDENTVKPWSIEEVLYQWHKLFNGTIFTQKKMRGEKLSKTIIKYVVKSAEEYRKRLIESAGLCGY